jgi:pimeloyl-ACP methyl ester carboxylesterase
VPEERSPSASQIDRRVRQVTRAGLVFDVIDSGPLDGHPVVLLHGFPQRASTWRPTMALLNESGFRTYALDQRGYSPGARPRGRRAHRTSELTADVVALIDRIGTPVTLMGHDWGAVVAWHLAQQRPDLIDHLVAASVPHPGAFFDALLRSEQFRMSWYILFFNLPFHPELFARLGWMAWWLKRIGMPADTLAAWRTNFADQGCLPGALGWYRAMPFMVNKRLWAHVTVPTTFVRSDGDQMLGRTGATLTPRYIDGPYRFIELAGLSHWLMDEAPEQLARQVIDGPPAV